MLEAMARTNEVIANAMGTGGLGKPSAVMATDSSQSGSRLTRVPLQELGIAQRVSLMVTISIAFP
jgi:hypothetical protein